jgi:succinoglycan biosynthesis protein ExoA
MSGNRRFPNESRSTPAGAPSVRLVPPPTEATWKGRELPFVSILMPIRNERDFIARSLQAVLTQDYPPDLLEVIVADGLSTDGTPQIVASFQPDHPNLRLIDNRKRIVATGLNLAVSQARGDVLVRVDGHCEVAPDYVRRCVEHLRLDGVQGVGGPLETIGDDSVARAIALAMSSWFGVGGSPFRTRHGETRLVDTVAFPAYRRTAVERAGHFDEELVRNQDDEYNYRLRKGGAKLLLAADVRCRYFSRSNFRSLWRQYFQYGYWKVRVLQKHPRQMRWRQFAPPAFAAAVLGGLVFAPFSRWGRLWLLALSVLYALAMTLGSLGAAHRGGWRLLPLLPPAFATLHFAYGSGFLAGLCRFWNRWGERGSSSDGARKDREDSAPL